MPRYAMIHNGIVENVILWDGVTPYDPGEGRTLIQTSEAQVGDAFSNGSFTRPAPPPPTSEELAASLSAVFDAQTVERRASFAPLRAAVQLELTLGHYDVVVAIIQGATIPPELEPIRAELLSKLEGLI